MFVILKLINCAIVPLFGTADFLGASALNAASAKPFLLVDNDEKLLRDADGKGVLSPADKDSVLIADLAGDGRPDLYFANDGVPCSLLENLGGLRFREVAVGAGVAVSGSGTPLAGMGVALADLDGDQRDDLAVTNFLDRGTVLFRSIGQGI